MSEDNNESFEQAIGKKKITKKKITEAEQKVIDASYNIAMTVDILHMVEDLSPKAKKYVMKIMEDSLEIISDSISPSVKWELPELD